jgi:hypothetical protein
MLTNWIRERKVDVTEYILYMKIERRDIHISVPQSAFHKLAARNIRNYRL